MEDRELRSAVVGIDYQYADGGNRRFEVELSAPGDPIRQHREPKIKHDEYAVGGVRRARRPDRISDRGTRSVNRPKLVAGKKLVADFLGLTGTVAYIRFRFGGGAPTLPVPTRTK